MSKKSITKNYIYNMIYEVLILILPLITTPYLSRVLGATGIGIYSYTYTIVMYFALFGSLGVALYGQREIAYVQDDIHKRNKIFCEIALFKFIAICISAIFYTLFFINGEQYNEYYKILLLELFASAFDISWFFQGIEEFKKTVLRNVLVRICSVSAVFVFVKSQNDLSTFVFIYSLADLLGNLTLWFYLPKYLKGTSIKNLNVIRHIPQILLLFVPQISNQLYKMLDTTMIGKIVEDKAELGFYEQSQKIIRLLLTVVTSLGVVMIPRMANTFANGDNKKVKEYLKMSFNFVFFFSFPIMFGISAIAKDFVPLFFGDGYEKVVSLIYILCPIILLMGLANVMGTQYLIPTKRQKEYTISIIIGVIVNFILNYVLINMYAAIGASIATVLSQVVVDIIQWHYLKSEIKFKDFINLSYKYLISGVVMFIICKVIRKLIAILNMQILFKNVQVFYFATIACQIIFGIIIYFGLLIALKDSYLYSFINRIKSKILKKEEL